MTTAYRKGIPVRTFIAGITAAVAGVSLCAAQANAQDTSGASQIRSILQFPIANGSGPAGDPIAPKIDDAVQMRLDAVQRFKVTKFNRRLATVQRGLEDKDLTDQDVVPPFGDNDTDQPRAAKIARRMDVDSYFVGDLDSFKADPATKTVTLQVTGTLYYTNPGPGQPESAKTIGASVTEKPQSASDTLDTVTQMAVDDAAGQIAGGINGLPATGTPAVVESSQHGHQMGSANAILAIAAGALLYAVLHHSSSSGSSSSSTTTSGSSGGPGNPPAPPIH